MCFVSVDSSAHLTQGLNGKQSAFPAPNRQRLNKTPLLWRTNKVIVKSLCNILIQLA